jgi:hypothetical protein
MSCLILGVVGTGYVRFKVLVLVLNIRAYVALDLDLLKHVLAGFDVHGPDLSGNLRVDVLIFLILIILLLAWGHIGVPVRPADSAGLQRWAISNCEGTQLGAMNFFRKRNIVHVIHMVIRVKDVRFIILAVLVLNIRVSVALGLGLLKHVLEGDAVHVALVVRAAFRVVILLILATVMHIF